MPSPNLSLLISSCDAYSDLWKPCFNLIEKRWPDCPYAIYLLSNELRYANPKINTLCVGHLGSWSDELAAALSLVPTEYVLIMLDDFFLRKEVSNSAIRHCLEFALLSKALTIKLVPNPSPTEKLPGEKVIGCCAADLPYRVSTQAAIWNRKQLLALLRPGESIWEFEHNVGTRLPIDSGVYSVWRPILPYEGLLSHHVVEKGRWLLHEKWIFSTQKIGCDFSRRKTLPLGRLFFYHLARFIDRLLSLLPWRLKRYLKRILKRLFQPLFREQIQQLSSGVSPQNQPLRK